MKKIKDGVTRVKGKAVVKEEEEKVVGEGAGEQRVEIDNIVKVEFSVVSVAKTVLMLLGFALLSYFLWTISGILFLFFVAFLFSAALDPLIDRLKQYRIPRFVSIILIYLLFFLLAALFIAQLLPILASQINSIVGITNTFIVDFSNGSGGDESIEMLRPYLGDLVDAFDSTVVLNQLRQSFAAISNQLLNLGSNVWEVILSAFNGLMNLIIFLILVFFMTVDEGAMERFTTSVLPMSYGPYVNKSVIKIKGKIGAWIRGQFLISLTGGIVTFIALAPFGVDYSLTLSVIAGISLIVPVFGRVFALLLALPIVLNQSLGLAVYVSVFYFLIAQVENNILVPYFMNKAVGLHPLVIIFAMMVGNQLLGVLGLILAVPVALILTIFMKDFSNLVYAEKRAKLVE